MKTLKLFTNLVVILLMTSCNINDELEFEEDIITNSINECLLDCEIDEGGPGGGTFEWSNYFYVHRGESNHNIYYATSNLGTSNWSTSQLGLGAQSSEGPTSLLFKNKRFIFYKGSNSHNIFYAYKAFTSAPWQGNQIINSDSETNGSISAAVFNDKVFVAHRGQTNDALYLNYSSTGLDTYTQVQALSTGDNVKDFSIVNNNGTMYIFWTKETDTEGLRRKIYYRTSTNPTDPNSWSDYIRLEETPAPFYSTSAENGLSVVALNGKIYMAFALQIDEPFWIQNRPLVFGVLDEDGNWDKVIYNDDTEAGNYRTQRRPGIMVSDDSKLLISFAGESTNRIYTMKVDTNGDVLTPPTETGGETKVGGVSSYSRFNQ